MDEKNMNEYFLDDKDFEGENVHAHTPFEENNNIEPTLPQKLKKVSTGSAIASLVFSILLGNVISFVFSILSLVKAKAFLSDRQEADYKSYRTFIILSRVFNIIEAVLIFLCVATFGILFYKANDMLTKELKKYGVEYSLSSVVSDKRIIDFSGFDIDNNDFPMDVFVFENRYGLTEANETTYETPDGGTIKVVLNKNKQICGIKASSKTITKACPLVTPSGLQLGKKISEENLSSALGKFKTERKEYDTFVLYTQRSINNPENYIQYKYAKASSRLAEFNIMIGSGKNK